MKRNTYGQFRLHNVLRMGLLMAFAVGMVAAIIGLFLNASYIDVFTASKVAEPFWALMGLLLAILYGISLKKVKTTKK